jgi:O-antigen/teichoic acid export membrane protein
MSLKRNTLWNLAGTLLPLSGAVISIPFLLNRLGSEALGVLTLIWTLIGYLSLFDFGIGRALIYEISRMRATADKKEISTTLRTGLLLSAITGLFGMALVMLLAEPLARNWLKIAEGLQDQAHAAFLIAAVAIVPTTLASAARGTLEAYGRFGESNVSRMVLGLFMFVAPAFSVIVHGPRLDLIAWYLISIRMISMVVLLIQVKSYWIVPAPIIRSERVSALFQYGSWVTVSGIVGPIMVYGDRFFVSAAVGAEQLPIYALPQEGLQRLLMLPAALCGALLPMLASATSIDDVRKLYAVNTRRVQVGMLLVCIAAAFLAYPFLSIWIDASFARAAFPIAAILIAGIWVNSIAQVPYSVLHARGFTKLTAQFHMFQLVFYIFALYYLTQLMGLAGAALAWTLRASLDYFQLRFAVNRLLFKK